MSQKRTDWAEIAWLTVLKLAEPQPFRESAREWLSALGCVLLFSLPLWAGAFLLWVVW